MLNHDARKLKSSFYLSVAILFCLCATGNYFKTYSQEVSAVTPDATTKKAETNVKLADTNVKNDAASIKPERKIKVTFDEKSPGGVIVESGGERIRIDTATKSVARLDDSMSTIPAPNASASPSPQNVKVETVTDDTDEPGSEPYDYRLINVPTPKRVPKHSLNLYFTHRFSEPVKPLRESG